MFVLETVQNSGADPGFLRQGSPTKKGGANLLFGQISPTTVWKWRILDRGGAHPKFYYVDPPTGISTVFLQVYVPSVSLKYPVVGGGRQGGDTTDTLLASGISSNHYANWNFAIA